MSGKAARVDCTEKQLDLLEQIIKSTRSECRLMQRDQIISQAFHGKRNQEIASLVGLHVGQVGIWRRRWQHSFDALVAIECRETQAQLMRSIEDVLSDAPRSGRPHKFTPEQGKIQADIKQMKIWMDGDRHESKITAFASEAIRFTERADDYEAKIAGLQEKLPALNAKIKELSRQLNQIEHELLEPYIWLTHALSRRVSRTRRL